MNAPVPPADPPVGAPIFRTWRRAYLAVTAVFVLEIALLYAFTRGFS